MGSDGGDDGGILVELSRRRLVDGGHASVGCGRWNEVVFANAMGRDVGFDAIGRAAIWPSVGGGLIGELARGAVVELRGRAVIVVGHRR